MTVLSAPRDTRICTRTARILGVSVTERSGDFDVKWWELFRKEQTTCLAALDLAARGGVVQRRAPGADGPHGRRRAGERLRGEVGVLVDEQVHAVHVAVQRGEVQRRQPAARRLVHEAAVMQRTR